MIVVDGCEKFFGKYRGKVEDNLDPLGLGRVKVSVADVLGDGTMAWAMPCFPGAGPGVGLYAIPPVGGNVWVEFERGEPDYPVYSGGFWDAGDAPVPMGPTQQNVKAWVGDGFRVEINDLPGLGELTISVTTATGDAVLSADASAMSLSFSGSSVKIDATGVTVNDGNLKVLP
ncbi:phage baseplate assembly protein V [Primorskyibacter sp. 2E233]|uniref:phage baseplate assembly protein V n=1 Tax=Primorskyibacter sp. 2E233 TaxID=3413431 RepID=UPI003BEFE3DD